MFGVAAGERMNQSLLFHTGQKCDSKVVEEVSGKTYSKILNKMYNGVKSNIYIFLLIQKAFEMTKKERKQKDLSKTESLVLT